MSGKNYSFKVVLLGEGCVGKINSLKNLISKRGILKKYFFYLKQNKKGKTSLMLRYINDQFNDKHLSTIQAAFMKKKLRIGGNSVELSIWDTAGQEKYHALSPIYYRGSNGAFLVYDITDTDSFQRVSRPFPNLKQAFLFYFFV